MNIDKTLESFDEEFEKNLAHHPHGEWLENAEEQKNKLKQFISNLLTKREKEIREELLNQIKEEQERGYEAREILKGIKAKLTVDKPLD